MVNELKPCPFCGGEANIGGWEEVGYFASCNNCYCCVGEAYDRSAMPEHMFKAEDEAITAWNASADTGRLSELEAEVARLREALTPFAAVYQSLPGGYRDDLWVGLSIAGSSALDHEYLTVRDFRSALEAKS